MTGFIALAHATPKADAKETGFGLRLWAFLSAIVFADALSILLAAVPRRVRELLSRPVVTSADLWRYLPRVVKGALSRSLYAKRGVYVIIGRHISGVYKRYGGVSKSVYHRSLVHTRIIDRLKRGKRVNKKRVLFCHEELAKPGWEVQIYCVAVFDPKAFWLYSYVLESLFMCLLGTIISTTTKNHKAAMSALVKSLDLNLVSGPPAIPLNKALSIAQEQSYGKDKSSVCCRVCRTKDSSKWCTHPAAKPFQEDSWACRNCYEYYYRRGVDRTLAQLERARSLHVASKIAPKDRTCNDCGKSEKEGRWRLNEKKFGTWLCGSCEDRQEHDPCTTCGITVSATGWIGTQCQNCRRKEINDEVNNDADSVCRECDITTSPMWHDKTNEAGPLCNKCYIKARNKPTGDEVCRVCKGTTSCTWYGKTDEAGLICNKCWRESKIQGDEQCRVCKRVTSSRWHDKKNPAGMMCTGCHQKAYNLARKQT